MSDRKRPENISIREIRRRFADGDGPDSLSHDPHSRQEVHRDGSGDFDLGVSVQRWKPHSQGRLNDSISFESGEGVAKSANGEVVMTVRGEHVIMHLRLDGVTPSNSNRFVGRSAGYEPKERPDKANHGLARPQRFYGGGEPKDVQPQRALVKPPGAGLMRLVASLPGSARLCKDLEQVIADMREEHFDALAAGDEHGAQIALRRGRYEVMRAIVPSWATGIFGAVAKWLVGRFLQS